MAGFFSRLGRGTGGLPALGGDDDRIHRVRVDTDYPGVDPELLVPGSVVFSGSAGPVPLNDPSNWWSYIPGARWRQSKRV